MSEERKKEPKTIHVDKLIIKADEVIFQPEPRHKTFSTPETEEREEIRRDFWGFPLPAHVRDQASKESDKKEETEEKKV